MPDAILRAQEHDGSHVVDPSPSPRLRMTVAAAALTAIGVAIVYAFDPATARFYPPCAFHALTGLQCPGCGGTRALHALLHGDVAAAMRLNPFLFVFMGATAVIAARPALLTRKWFAWVAAGVLLGWGLLRNVWGL